MVPPLSSAAEAKIRKALEAVADLTSDGDDPNDAIVKVAGDAGLPPGHVDLLVRGYNIARTTWQRESGADVMEKAADFPLADPEKVRKRLFVDHIKEAHLNLPPCADYDSTSWYQQHQEKAAKARLQSMTLPPLTDKKAPALQEDPQILAKRAYATAQDRLRALENQRLELADVQQKLYRTFEKIAAALAPLGSPGLEDLRPDVSVLYGKTGDAILDQVGRMRPMLLKRASKVILVVDPKREPFASIANAVSLTDEFRQKLAAYQRAEVKCDEAVLRHLAPYIKQASDPEPLLEGLNLNNVIEPQPKQAAESCDLLDNLNNVIEPPQEKQALGQFAHQVGLGVAISGVRDQLAGIGNKLNDVAKKDEAVNKALQRISSPDHEDQLREIQTRAMLQDLLTSDPVISGYDPHEVASAYNELSQLAPRTAAQPVLARALLRKQLQLGALDSFEGNEAVSTEHKLRDLQPVYQALPKPTGANNAVAAGNPK